MKTGKEVGKRNGSNILYKPSDEGKGEDARIAIGSGCNSKNAQAAKDHIRKSKK